MMVADTLKGLNLLMIFSTPFLKEKIHFGIYQYMDDQ